MPIYEYECEQCHEITEAWQKFSDPPLSKCPHCGGKLHKIISLNSFHLKGEGWYVTDYKRKDSGGNKTKSNNSSSSSSSQEGGSKTD